LPYPLSTHAKPVSDFGSRQGRAVMQAPSRYHDSLFVGFELIDRFTQKPM
jgi:hypothetical protein